MVGSTHIDAMLTAGLQDSRYGPLRWTARDLTDDEKREAYQAGDPWGPGMIEIYGQLHRELTDETAGYVGAMLLAENRASVDHRYNESEIEEPYLFRALKGSVDPIVVLKAISCYEYQSCEHPEWEQSEARRFCLALTDKMVGMLPGYEAAPWEISDRDIFFRAQVSP